MGDWECLTAGVGGSEEGGEAGGLMLGYQKSTAGLTPLFTLVNHGITRDRGKAKASPAVVANPNANANPEPEFQQYPKHPGTTAEALGRGVDFWYSSMRLPGPGPQRCKHSKTG